MNTGRNLEAKIAHANQRLYDAGRGVVIRVPTHDHNGPSREPKVDFMGLVTIDIGKCQWCFGTKYEDHFTVSETGRIAYQRPCSECKGVGRTMQPIPVFIEAKSGIGRLTKKQKALLKAADELGAFAFVHREDRLIFMDKTEIQIPEGRDWWEVIE